MNSSPVSSQSFPDEDWIHQLNPQQMFTLIDRLLPLEACLYYQVLPLSLEGSRLNLGMVDPEDTAAADYVRRLLSYINCSVTPRPISSAAHREMLSKYLSHSGQSSSKTQPLLGQPNQPQPQAFSPPPRPATPPPRPKESDRNLQATFIVDSPEELDLPDEAPPAVQPSNPRAPEPASAPLQSAPPSASAKAPQTGSVHAAAQSAAPKPSPSEVEESFLASKAPPPLNISVNHSSSPLETLVQLPPRVLLHELLGRVLVSGIGRLYFERQPHQGRILWSQNGVMQSVLDNLDANHFQGVLNELKRLMEMPLLPVKTTKQVEVERLYKGAQLLLRFRVIPGTHGEEATLQVLRGAALKFYQQQLIGSLGRDALGLAQKLQQRVHEIRDRARSELNLSRSQIEALPALRELLHQLDQQVEEIMRQNAEQDAEDSQS